MDFFFKIKTNAMKIIILSEKVLSKVGVARKLGTRVTYCSKFIAVVFNKFLLESGK